MPSPISERLIRFRIVFKLTRNQLSKLLGISVNTLRNYERGDRGMSMDVLNKYGDVFGEETMLCLLGRRSSSVLDNIAKEWRALHQVD